jgi:hypothetical protein
VGVDHTGTANLRTEIEKLGSGVERALLNVSHDIADDVLSYVRSRIPRVTGNAAGSYKITHEQTGTEISFGGTQAPYVPWLEFGGKAGRSGAKRPYVPGGRYLYPGIRSVSEAWEDEILKALDGLSDLDVT